MKGEVLQSRRRRTTYDKMAPHHDRAVRPVDRWFLARLPAMTLAYLPKDGPTLEIGPALVSTSFSSGEQTGSGDLLDRVS
jgi:hypothetical protein